MEAVEGGVTTQNINATMVVPNSIDDEDIDNKENNDDNDEDEQLYAEFIPPAKFSDNQNENDNVGLIN